MRTDLTKELVEMLKQTTFVVETVAHLQGKEAALLPLTEAARTLIDRVMGSGTYNFDIRLDTGKYTVEVDTAENYGHFEHNELGDESAGGLWFEDKTLTDYDGVFALPAEVAKALREKGYVVESEAVEGE